MRRDHLRDAVAVDAAFVRMEALCGKVGHMARRLLNTPPGKRRSDTSFAKS
jgi:hypothetical protein